MMDSIDMNQLLLWFAGFGAAVLLSPLLGESSTKSRRSLPAEKVPVYFNFITILQNC